MYSSKSEERSEKKGMTLEQLDKVTHWCLIGLAVLIVFILTSFAVIITMDNYEVSNIVNEVVDGDNQIIGSLLEANEKHLVKKLVFADNPSDTIGTNRIEQSSKSTLFGSVTQFIQELVWKFVDFAFLLGWNVPTFEKANLSAITIPENNTYMSKVVPVFEYIDSWLDNYLLNASETFFCHHEERNVVEMENLQYPVSFEENLIIQKSQKLLAISTGHSYCFYKGSLWLASIIGLTLIFTFDGWMLIVRYVFVLIWKKKTIQVKVDMTARGEDCSATPTPSVTESNILVEESLENKFCYAVEALTGVNNDFPQGDFPLKNYDDSDGKNISSNGTTDIPEHCTLFTTCTDLITPEISTQRGSSVSLRDGKEFIPELPPLYSKTKFSDLSCTNLNKEPPLNSQDYSGNKYNQYNKSATEIISEVESSKNSPKGECSTKNYSDGISTSAIGSTDTSEHLTTFNSGTGLITYGESTQCGSDVTLCGIEIGTFGNVDMKEVNHIPIIPIHVHDDVVDSIATIPVTESNLLVEESLENKFCYAAEALADVNNENENLRAKLVKSRNQNKKNLVKIEQLTAELMETDLMADDVKYQVDRILNERDKASNELIKTKAAFHDIKGKLHKSQKNEVELRSLIDKIQRNQREYLYEQGWGCDVPVTTIPLHLIPIPLSVGDGNDFIPQLPPLHSNTKSSDLSYAHLKKESSLKSKNYFKIQGNQYKKYSSDSEIISEVKPSVELPKENFPINNFNFAERLNASSNHTPDTSAHATAFSTGTASINLEERNQSGSDFTVSWNENGRCETVDLMNDLPSKYETCFEIKCRQHNIPSAEIISKVESLKNLPQGDCLIMNYNEYDGKNTSSNGTIEKSDHCTDLITFEVSTQQIRGVKGGDLIDFITELPPLYSNTKSSDLYYTNLKKDPPLKTENYSKIQDNQYKKYSSDYDNISEVKPKKNCPINNYNFSDRINASSNQTPETSVLVTAFTTGTGSINLEKRNQSGSDFTVSWNENGRCESVDLMKDLPSKYETCFEIKCRQHNIPSAEIISEVESSKNLPQGDCLIMNYNEYDEKNTSSNGRIEISDHCTDLITFEVSTQQITGFRGGDLIDFITEIPPLYSNTISSDLLYTNLTKGQPLTSEDYSENKYNQYNKSAAEFISEVKSSKNLPQGDCLIMNYNEYDEKNISSNGTIEISDHCTDLITFEVSTQQITGVRGGDLIDFITELPPLYSSTKSSDLLYTNLTKGPPLTSKDYSENKYNKYNKSAAGIISEVKSSKNLPQGDSVTKNYNYCDRINASTNRTPETSEHVTTFSTGNGSINLEESTQSGNGLTVSWNKNGRCEGVDLMKELPSKYEACSEIKCTQYNKPSAEIFSEEESSKNLPQGDYNDSDQKNASTYGTPEISEHCTIFTTDSITSEVSTQRGSSDSLKDGKDLIPELPPLYSNTKFSDLSCTNLKKEPPLESEDYSENKYNQYNESATEVISEVKSSKNLPRGGCPTKNYNYCDGINTARIGTADASEHLTTFTTGITYEESTQCGSGVTLCAIENGTCGNVDMNEISHISINLIHVHDDVVDSIAQLPVPESNLHVDSCDCEIISKVKTSIDSLKEKFPINNYNISNRKNASSNRTPETSEHFTAFTTARGSINLEENTQSGSGFTVSWNENGRCESVDLMKDLPSKYEPCSEIKCAQYSKPSAEIISEVESSTNLTQRGCSIKNYNESDGKNTSSNRTTEISDHCSIFTSCTDLITFEVSTQRRSGDSIGDGKDFIIELPSLYSNSKSSDLSYRDLEKGPPLKSENYSKTRGNQYLNKKHLCTCEIISEVKPSKKWPKKNCPINNNKFFDRINASLNRTAETSEHFTTFTTGNGSIHLEQTSQSGSDFTVSLNQNGRCESGDLMKDLPSKYEPCSEIKCAQYSKPSAEIISEVESSTNLTQRGCSIKNYNESDGKNTSSNRTTEISDHCSIFTSCTDLITFEVSTQRRSGDSIGDGKDFIIELPSLYSNSKSSDLSYRDLEKGPPLKSENYSKTRGNQYLNKKHLCTCEIISEVKPSKKWPKKNCPINNNKFFDRINASLNRTAETSEHFTTFTTGNGSINLEQTSQSGSDFTVSLNQNGRCESDDLMKDLPSKYEPCSEIKCAQYSKPSAEIISEVESSTNLTQRGCSIKNYNESDGKNTSSNRTTEISEHCTIFTTCTDLITSEVSTQRGSSDSLKDGKDFIPELPPLYSNTEFSDLSCTNLKKEPPLKSEDYSENEYNQYNKSATEIISEVKSSKNLPRGGCPTKNFNYCDGINTARIGTTDTSEHLTTFTTGITYEESSQCGSGVTLCAIENGTCGNVDMNEVSHIPINLIHVHDDVVDSIAQLPVPESDLHVDENSSRELTSLQNSKRTSTIQKKYLTREDIIAYNKEVNVPFPNIRTFSTSDYDLHVDSEESDDDFVDDTRCRPYTENMV